jgi:hypothetical protein
VETLTLLLALLTQEAEAEALPILESILVMVLQVLQELLLFVTKVNKNF